MRKKTLLSAAVVCLAAASLNAQSQAVTHVAIYKIKPGKEAVWTDLVNKRFAPVLNQLMQDGDILAYGASTDLLHSPGEANADAWYTVPNMTAYQKVSDAIRKAQASMGADAQQLMDAMDGEKHMDLLLAPIFGRGKTVAPGGSAFHEVSVAKVKAGMGEDYKKGFETYLKPIYEKLVDDGTILGYGLYQQAFHTQDIGYRWLVISASNLSAWDKIHAAFDEDRKRRSTEDWSAIMAKYRTLTDAEAHRDYLSRAIVFASK